MEKNQETSSMINELTYTRGIGAYKPHFEGVPETYYPLSCLEICYGLILLFGCIGITLGIMIAFQFWIVKTNDLETYVIIWVAVFLAFTVITIWLFYTGGKDRRRQEKELIAESSRKQQEMISRKK